MASLEKIARLAADLARYESRIEATEKTLSQLKSMARRIAEVELPEAMDAEEVTEFRMADGRRISVGMDVHAGIPKAQEQEAFDWLRAHGFDSIIKRDISIKFGKGEDAQAQFVTDLLKAHQLEPDIKQAIHHSTLKAFVREQIEDGQDIPLDLFGAYVVRRAKVAGAS